MKLEYCLFETPIGSCGIAWKAQSSPALVVFQLPEANDEMTELSIGQRLGGGEYSNPPPQITKLIQKVRKHLDGEIQDFQDTPLALDKAGAFAKKVYEAARKIPAGQTLTYGELARKIGKPGAARAVGNALGKNPIALIIPCHRVLAANGKPGGFSAHGGKATKAKMLAAEGVKI